MWSCTWMAVLLWTVVAGQDMVTSIPPGESGVATPTLQKGQVKPIIRSLHITTDIKNRYATTLVSTRVINPLNQSGEATFTVTLPESAFISEFLMEIKDKVYKAYVKEKEEAKAIYQEAVNAGHFAGHVALDARDSNQFTVSVNIEAHGKVTFNLTYEQLLARNLGVYSNVININPQQVVDDMSVVVNIKEPTAIINLEVPELQISNEAIPEKENKQAKIEDLSPNEKKITWAPTAEEQRSQNSSGLSGQFMVKYDVDRTQNPQQILVDEGYFVHFFAPESLPKLRKHVIFVLDYSGSMSGRKLEQLKEAMKQIFTELGPKDYFSIVIFQSWVEVWSPTGMYITSVPSYVHPMDAAKIERENKNKTLSSQFVVEASPANIELARSFMENYTDLGSTNIIGGLRTGLELVKIADDQWANESDPPQPVMVFLTDGQPNVEEYDTDAIINKTKALNTKQCPIFSLAFGYGAEFNFLRKLSLQNSGFARNIYEGADATLQLKNFYKTIASPILSNVTFNYLPGQVDNSSNTKVEFPVFFSGSELVVAGKINNGDESADRNIGQLRGVSATGLQSFDIIIPLTMFKPKNRSIGHLEKSWSYLTIQQLLDKMDSLDDGEEKNKTKKQALDLALQYAFVTPLTSLVVVKPNETESSVDATKINPGLETPQGLSGAMFASSGFSGGGALNFAVPMAASAFGAGGYGGGFPSAARPAVLSTIMPHGGMMGLSGMAPAMEELDSLLGPVPVTPTKVKLEDIRWLQQALNATEKTITLEGNQYKLGLNETNVHHGTCQADKDVGECLHIQYCALDVFQDDISQFLPYQCKISGNFLGVCCPTSLV
ncbi:inter-alpha-trypsin inhibitor heavy chain H3-like isoform X2 [Macrosteles quadrilineatus]|uniref:inter-alpha-trypsin inhibitor heavy chain H3-like isoform X2 n=1 Tax=Macrosteles quadrilineatus TaxID=74068 RepID=UPI0023E32EB5|nr:inter-alpha-trypsin inhibitor heavy chain H3-like isoform X2 [Macrosteles quadrilineatus]